MSSIDHLHSETTTLPLQHSLALRCQQFLAGALRTDHPSHAVVSAYSGPRSMKYTLQSRFLPSIGHLVQDGSIPHADYPAALRDLHTRAVADSVSSMGPNRVLGVRPPLVDPSELELGRAQRTSLAQLRSGHSSRLNSFLHRVGRAPSPECPDCHLEDHTVHHIFECTAAPTLLTPIDLWEHPREVIDFISTTSSFSFLQPPVVPPIPTGPGPPGPTGPGPPAGPHGALRPP